MKRFFGLLAFLMATAYEPGLIYLALLLAMCVAGVYGILCASWGD